MVKKKKTSFRSSFSNSKRKSQDTSQITVNKQGVDDDIPSTPVDETIPNPNFFWGSGTFELPNGDIYEGEYCCHKSGIIWREGIGTYKTKDGHVYIAKWENDQILYSPETHITYPNKDMYSGAIKKNKYNGVGTYHFNNNLSVTALFENNKPVGELMLTDFNNHMWKGKELNFGIMHKLTKRISALILKNTVNNCNDIYIITNLVLAIVYIVKFKLITSYLIAVNNLVSP